MHFFQISNGSNLPLANGKSVIIMCELRCVNNVQLYYFNRFIWGEPCICILSYLYNNELYL